MRRLMAAHVGNWSASILDRYALIANRGSLVRTDATKLPRNRTGCRLWSIPPLHGETQANPEDAHRSVRPTPPPRPGTSPVGVGVESILVALPGRIENEDDGSHPDRGPAERGVKRVPGYEFSEIDPWQNR